LIRSGRFKKRFAVKTILATDDVRRGSPTSRTRTFAFFEESTNNEHLLALWARKRRVVAVPIGVISVRFGVQVDSHELMLTQKARIAPGQMFVLVGR
jgi:hypothetical protein